MYKHSILQIRNKTWAALAVFTTVWICHLPLSHAAPDTEPRFGGTYRAPLLTEPTTLDPALFTDIYSMNVANNIFDGLVQFDKELNVRPAIAKRWKIARDYRTYTFELRKGVRFHNGREVVAADFVNSFSRLLDPQIASPAASLFYNIEGAEAYRKGDASEIKGLRAPQRYTLKIQLRKPFAPFLSILAMANAKVVPVEALDADFGKQPVGTGPFKFGTWKSGESINLKANTDYFSGPVYLEALHFQFYDGRREHAFADFELGRLDHALIPSDQYESVMANAGNNSYQMLNKPGLKLIYLGINQAIIPFDDVRVRQAVNYAVDTDAIVKNIIKRGSVPARGILPPGLAGFDPQLNAYDYNPDKARALLSEAGFPQGKGFPAIEAWTVAKSVDVHEALKAYQAYLGAVGIEVSIKVADSWKAFVEAITAGRAGLFYAAWYADYPDADNFFYPLLHSSSRTNRTGFSDSFIDEKIAIARAETDYLKRASLYREIEKRVVQSAPIISQHIDNNSYVFQPQVKGIVLNHLGVVYLPFHQLWLSDQGKLKQQSMERRNPANDLAASK